jgi:hypothetical protein
MIIFGSQKTTLGTYELPLTQCKHCNSSKTLLYRVSQKYGHVFWIPMFPIEKIVITVCTHCKQSLVDEQIYPEYWKAISNQNIKHKAPFWTFIGLVIFGIIILSIIIGALGATFHRKHILSNPQKGDIYFIRDKNWNYSLFKVAEASSDSVYLNKSVLSVNQRAGFDMLKNELGVYDSITIGYSKKDILKVYSEGKLVEIIRNN